MKARLIMTAVIILTLFATSFATSALADRGRDDNNDRRERKSYRSERSDRHRYQEDRQRQERYRNDKNYVFDQRYNHNRYYPKPGHVIKKLPRDYRVFKHRRDDYYFDSGIWYRPSNLGFRVILPPIGLSIPMLPPFYTTIWVRGMPYYYADGVYYMWRAEDRVYVVTDPPNEEAVTAPATPEKLFIYPKAGQSKEQQATDSYECHRWSVNETGFDPSKPGGDVEEGQNLAKRIEYQRAMKACLEARDYSVQ